MNHLPCPWEQERPFIIAELGTGHEGDRVRAGELIAAAAESGADCVKFQMVYAEEILHPKTGNVALPGGDIPLFERFKALELPPDFYAEMKEEAEKQGLFFLCTPFGPRSARELRNLRPGAVKIASPELNYTALLETTASWELPVFLSSGITLLSDIEAALAFFPRRRVCLLHCVTSYPAPPEDYNLRLLLSLSAVFGCATGVSDHSMDAALVPVLAAGLGAGAIEKHFCLSRRGTGLDDPIALPPEDFALMTRRVRAAAKARRGFFADAAPNQAAEAGLSRGIPARLLEEFYDEWGEKTVEAVLGSGVKVLAPSEKANYLSTRRSIHALRDIQAGETIEKDMIGALRSEKKLKPGLPPSFERFISGRKARRFIPDGQGLDWDDI
ncbi:MAG: N-acetylneuraminate synthase family protein [Spirochaetaceae bacterium]|jgi:sialic acid synthase SpsE|nr:N-acetylneuraminate synthase family protein [Spirochaetaceae bacterium]